jgi:hypothetical protein
MAFTPSPGTGSYSYYRTLPANPAWPVYNGANSELSFQKAYNQPTQSSQSPCNKPATPCTPAKKEKLSPSQATEKVLGAIGLLSVGMLLHQLPPRLPGDGFKTILPSDWKVWARVLLGIQAIHQINQAVSWSPPPWLGALEAVSIINPLAVGFSKNAIKQTVVMAPIVAAVVQGASLLRQTIAPTPKGEGQCQTTPMLLQAGITAGLGLAAMVAYPWIYKRVASTGIIGHELKEKASQETSAFASATFATCARGCSPGSFICLSELSDIVGGFITGLPVNAGKTPSTASSCFDPSHTDQGSHSETHSLQSIHPYSSAYSSTRQSPREQHP